MAQRANLITNLRCLNSWVLLLLIKVQVLHIPSRPYHPATFPLQRPVPTHSHFLPPGFDAWWLLLSCSKVPFSCNRAVERAILWRTLDNSSCLCTPVYLSNPCCQSLRKVFFDLFGGQSFFASWLSQKKPNQPILLPMTVSTLFTSLSHFCIPLYIPRAWCEYGLENYVSISEWRGGIMNGCVGLVWGWDGSVSRQPAWNSKKAKWYF